MTEVKPVTETADRGVVLVTLDVQLYCQTLADWTLYPPAKILTVNMLPTPDNNVSKRLTATLSFCVLTVRSFVRNAALQEWAAS